MDPRSYDGVNITTPYWHSYQTTESRDAGPVVKSSRTSPPTWSLILPLLPRRDVIEPEVSIPYRPWTDPHPSTLPYHRWPSATRHYRLGIPTSLRFPMSGGRPVRSIETKGIRCLVVSRTPPPHRPIPCHRRGKDSHWVPCLTSLEGVVTSLGYSRRPQRSSFLTSTGVTVIHDDRRRTNGKKMSLFGEDQGLTRTDALPHHFCSGKEENRHTGRT